MKSRPRIMMVQLSTPYTNPDSLSATMNAAQRHEQTDRQAFRWQYDAYSWSHCVMIRSARRIQQTCTQ